MTQLTQKQTDLFTMKPGESQAEWTDRVSHIQINHVRDAVGAVHSLVDVRDVRDDVEAIHEGETISQFVYPDGSYELHSGHIGGDRSGGLDFSLSSIGGLDDNMEASRNKMVRAWDLHEQAHKCGEGEDEKYHRLQREAHEVWKEGAA